MEVLCDSFLNYLEAYIYCRQYITLVLENTLVSATLCGAVIFSRRSHRSRTGSSLAGSASCDCLHGDHKDGCIFSRDTSFAT